MKINVHRFANNPLLAPENLRPSRPDFEVTCVLNPGAFRFGNRIGLLLRVAERPVPETGSLATPVLREDGTITVLRVRRDDPGLSCVEARSFVWNGRFLLTTMSHLLPAWSDDGGRTFVPDYNSRLFPALPCEAYGIEDARVEEIDGEYLLTFTAVGPAGITVGCRCTRDWKHFTPTELILPPSNKDAALFPRRINGKYYLLHRPSDPACGNHIYLAESPDLRCWGNHRCIAMTRPGYWDEERIGAGAAPVETDSGWLEIYHGADRTGRYALGCLLLDRDDPARVIARSEIPFMEPEADYEKHGFYGNCIFTNGQIVDGDRILLYYGASDSVVCGAEVRISELLNSLRTGCPGRKTA
ncbi:glycoside hydrolase family 130 protein [uncultured Victivallis sp.]|uniref:glycoside hydrolase family 130 protein n=1 Tax=uncultured Victivallis sp. TaxID=354118 RepID=UPI0025DA2476|nr:glycoside hydrolase family 130 protein [uncultured Victivallis sp.]